MASCSTPRPRIPPGNADRLGEPTCRNGTRTEAPRRPLIRYLVVIWADGIASEPGPCDARPLHLLLNDHQKRARRAPGSRMRQVKMRRTSTVDWAARLHKVISRFGLVSRRELSVRCRLTVFPWHATVCFCHFIAVVKKCILLLRRRFMYLDLMVERWSFTWDG